MRKNSLVFLFCFVVGTIFVMLCSKSSPIYPFNDWVDVNILTSVGKGMFNGQVLYRDVFDHKGPYVYPLFGLLNLVSGTSFLGLYLLEIIAATCFMFVCYKIYVLFFDHWLALILVPVVAGLTYPTTHMSHGGSVEELMLPLFAIVLYYLVINLKSGIDMTAFQMIVIGFIAGLTLWMKYTLLGFLLGVMIVLTIEFILKKQYRKMLVAFAWSGVGLLIATMPAIIYFAYFDALYYLWQVYFYEQIMTYRMQSPIFMSLGVAGWNNPLIVCYFLMMCFFALHKPFMNNRRQVFYFIGIYLLMFVIIFQGGRIYGYYAMVFMFFNPLLLIAIAHYIKTLLNGKSFKINQSYLYKAIPIVVVASSFGSFLGYQHNHQAFKSITQTPQYIFTQIIKQEPKESQTLLNFANLDHGMFTMTGIVPNTRYFCLTNFNKPAHLQEQIKYLENRQVTFVATWFKFRYYNEWVENRRFYIPELDEPVPSYELLKHYELVEEAFYDFEGEKHVYLLFKVKA